MSLRKYLLLPAAPSGACGLFLRRDASRICLFRVCDSSFPPDFALSGAFHGETAQNARPELGGIAQYLFAAPSDIMEAEAPSAPADAQDPRSYQKEGTEA